MALFGRKTQDSVVDLRDRRPEPKFGYPTPCPQCGGNGYLDSIDLTAKRMFQHCPSCFAKWETTEEELASR
jgi:hypothetical protein